MRTEKLCVIDCVRLAIPKRAEGKHVGNRTDPTSIFARSNFLNVL
jgi:hypothetical protein